MEDLKIISLPDLFDSLAAHTTAYMKMITAGATNEEFKKSQESMKAIQLEIELRKAKGHTTT